MAMDAQTIEALIREGIPDADVKIEDLRGDGDHYAAYVTAASFEGKNRVQQHQMVYSFKVKWGESFTPLPCKHPHPKLRGLNPCKMLFLNASKKKLKPTMLCCS
jgi:acid stress-induced BolA-like protein IbaG/YrbA